MTLDEYIQSAQMGLTNQLFGPDVLRKQSYLESNDVFNKTYGRQVFSAMNNRTVFYNAVTKTPWGPTYGWRLRTARGGSSGPIREGENIPTIAKSTYTTIGSPPKVVGTSLGVTIQNIFLSGLEGGLGDVYAVEQAEKEKDHAKEINQQLLAGSYTRVASFDTLTFTVPSPTGLYFKKGDVIRYYDTSADEEVAVDMEVQSSTATTIVVDTVTGTPVAGDILYAYSRAGITSIDDIASGYGTVVGSTNSHDAKMYPRCYDWTARTNSYQVGCRQDYNGGVARDFALKQVDDAIQACREAGGEPGLILSGYDQLFKAQRLLEAERRFMSYEKFQFGVGSERTYPGTEAGLTLASYMGLPWMADIDCPKSIDNNGVVQGSKIFVLDLNHLDIGIAMETQYMENRNIFVSSKLVVQGLLYTMLELRARRPDVMAVIGDLKA